MKIKVPTWLLIFACIPLVTSLGFKNIVITVMSQSDPYNAGVARNLKDDIENQTRELETDIPIVHLTHEDFNIPLAWTIVPLMQPLVTMYNKSSVRWIVFLESNTVVNCEKLLDILTGEGNVTDHDVYWIGNPVKATASVIHDYEKHKLVYPNFACGFAMRFDFMKTLLNRVKTSVRMQSETIKDAAFELARLVYGKNRKQGPKLEENPGFCSPYVEPFACAVFPKPFDICGKAISEDTIFFAVKTWVKYHSTRVEVIKKTWGEHVTHLMFYSDETDLAIPSVDVGVPNTIEGHYKTMATLKMIVKQVGGMPKIQWIFLADDDTMIGVRRLSEVLSCYNGGEDFTVLGERYGFGNGKREDTSDGYSFDYIALGGGVAFSVRAADVMSRCPVVDLMDDISLGVCALKRHLRLTHSPLFHQEQPEDYPKEVLARDRPVSFHHCTTEAASVYALWFHNYDFAMENQRKRELSTSTTEAPIETKELSAIMEESSTTNRLTSYWMFVLNYIPIVYITVC